MRPLGTTSSDSVPAPTQALITESPGERLPAAPHEAGVVLLATLKKAQAVDFSLSPSKLSPGVVSTLNQSVLEGGKRVRPTLVFLVGELLGISSVRASPGFGASAEHRLLLAAKAIEWTHSASLAHDDVIDASAMRRGKPTLPRLVGAHRAILGGDLLLAHVIEALLAAREQALALSLAAAIRELSLGEWLECENRRNSRLSGAELERIHRLKTASLTRWAAEAAPRVCGLPPETVQLFGSFGEALGFAFQLADDVLDFEEDTGKPFAQDLREGVINSVTLRLLEWDPGLRGRLADFFNATEALDPRALFSEAAQASALASAKEAVIRDAEKELNLGLENLLKACALAEGQGIQPAWHLVRSEDLRRFLKTLVLRAA
jgi:geranylgeranyl pyrophosphate synthase